MANKPTPFYDRPIFALCIVLGTVIILIGLHYVLGRGMLSWDYWLKYDSNITSTRSEVVRNLGILIAAVIGLGFGIWRAYTAHQQSKAALKQADTAEQGQFTERFSVAVGQLGDDMLPVRLGGIYALWRLAEDSPARDLTKVLDILCAFVRHPPHQSESSPATETNETVKDSEAPETPVEVTLPLRVRPDVQTILNLLVRPNEQRVIIPGMYRIDFSNANLDGANLIEADLTGADLRWANLNGAILSGADFVGAVLIEAKLIGAKLIGAKLSAAYLTGADLSEANLNGANLIGAKLNWAKLNWAKLGSAKLCRASLFSANLNRAYLTGANLIEADLTGADLSGADFVRVNLTGANLSRTDLSRTDLSRTDLSRTDLSRTDLSGVTNIPVLSNSCFDGENAPVLPDGVAPPTKICDRYKKNK